MKNNIPQLRHASQKIESINRALLDEKLILFITSTPSYSFVLNQAFPTKNIQSITGANNHEYQGILKALRHQEVDILILGIEQLINPTKIDVVLSIITRHVGHVIIDHIHHLSLYSHDIKAEYFTLKKLYATLKQAQWHLFSYALSIQDKQVIADVFTSVSDSTTKTTIPIAYYSTSKTQQLQLLLDYAEQGNILIVSHDYIQAEITAFKLNRLIPSGVIHRKVEETNKVALTSKWQQSSLQSLVTTSDTLLPYPYPSVDTILWIQTPLNLTQMQEWHHRFSAKQSIVVGSIESNAYCLAASHNFPYDETLTQVIKIISNHPQGLTMREMEHYLNIESYTLEKVLKGLKAFEATKKVQSKYVVHKPWELNQLYSLTIQKVQQQAHQTLRDILLQHQLRETMHVSDKVEDVYNHVALPLRPKVLFPIGFYPKSLIYEPWLSKTGYVFEEAYKNIQLRSNDIIHIINGLSDTLEEVSIVSLSMYNDSIDLLTMNINQRLDLPFIRVFNEFDSSVLADNLNPYHKLKAITEQLQLNETSHLKATTFVVADHADHYWQMAVAAYELLSKGLTKQVIVIFNQP